MGWIFWTRVQKNWGIIAISTWNQTVNFTLQNCFQIRVKVFGVPFCDVCDFPSCSQNFSSVFAFLFFYSETNLFVMWIVHYFAVEESSKAACVVCHIQMLHHKADIFLAKGLKRLWKIRLYIFLISRLYFDCVLSLFENCYRKNSPDLTKNFALIIWWKTFLGVNQERQTWFMHLKIFNLFLHFIWVDLEFKNARHKILIPPTLCQISLYFLNWRVDVVDQLEDLFWKFVDFFHWRLVLSEVYLEFKIKTD